MHTITWSNGSRDTARTWQALLDRIRRAQWIEMEEDEFRAEMGKRAWVWSETVIDIGASPRRFFEELERARMIQIERSK